MKSTIITSIFINTLLLISFSVKAQTPQNITAEVNITLTDVMSIDPNSSINAKAVNFQYKNESDYRKNQSIARDSYLIITTTQAFDVKVKADGPNFIGEGNAAGSLIPVNVLTVDASSNDFVNATAFVINLSAEDQTIISGASKGSERHMNIKYSIPESKSQSPDILGKPGGNYVQSLTYSVVSH